jgi:hypothetical protein
MIVRGTVQGGAAYHAGYAYYHILPDPMPTMQELDPNRLHWWSEYPRDTAIYLPNIKKVRLMDYEFHISRVEKTSQHSVRLLLVPNKYSGNREPLQIRDWVCTSELVLGKNLENYLDHLLKEALSIS